MTALLTDGAVDHAGEEFARDGAEDNLGSVSENKYAFISGARFARSIYEARLAEAMRLLREIASYEPLSDSDGGFISTWEEIEAFLAIYAKEDKS